MGKMSDIYIKRCESIANKIMRMTDSEKATLIFEFFGDLWCDDEMQYDLAYDIAQSIIDGRFRSKYFAKNTAT